MRQYGRARVDADGMPDINSIPRVLQITAAISSGSMFSASRPAALIAYSTAATRLDGPGTVTLLRRGSDGVWQELSHELSPIETSGIDALLSEMGIPGRRPQVEGEVDTSDWHSTLYLLLNLWDRQSARPVTCTIQLDTMSSGYAGADAHRLHRLLMALLPHAALRPAPESFLDSIGLWTRQR